MMKNLVLRVSIAVFACGALWVAYTQNPSQQINPNQASKLTTIKLKDDLYVIHNDFVPGNTTALITSEGVVLVDDKFEVDYNNILAEVKKLTPQPVKYVVNTHHHFDHSGSNAKFQATGVPIVSTEEARENMIEAKQPGATNIVFEHHAHIYLGGKNVELYHFGRAHTNGDLVALFPADRVLAAGDMFTFGNDVPELIDYSGGGSAKEWPKTLDGALALQFDTVVPGHGPVTTKAEMTKYRESTVRLKNRIHEMLGQKKSRADIAKMLTAEFHWAQLHLDRGLDGAMAELQ